MIVVGSGTGANYPIVAGALAALDVEITGLVSTSGSGLPMAFAAAGRPMSEFLEVAKKIRPEKIIKPRGLGAIVSPGIFTIDPVREIIEKYGPKSFGDCVIPHRVVSFDTDMREQVVFGDVDAPYADALTSSMAMPWLMAPVKVGMRRCSDGGTVNNFAIDIVDEPAIGIRIRGSQESCQPKSWRWWGGYSLAHLDGVIRARENFHIATDLWKKHKIITIDSPISSLAFWQLSGGMIDRLYKIGFDAVTRWQQ